MVRIRYIVGGTVTLYIWRSSQEAISMVGWDWLKLAVLLSIVPLQLFLTSSTSPADAGATRTLEGGFGGFAVVRRLKEYTTDAVLTAWTRLKEGLQRPIRQPQQSPAREVMRLEDVEWVYQSRWSRGVV